MNTLQTGDIILFRGDSAISYVIECFSNSPYSHVGMIIRDPRRIGINIEDGLYVLESGNDSLPDSIDKQFELGVQLHRLEDVLSLHKKKSVYIRNVDVERTDFFYHKLGELYRFVINASYNLEPWDWLMALYETHYQPIIQTKFKRTDRFWCSALLAYLYDRLHLINQVDWTLIAPKDFSESGIRLHFRCDMSPERLLK